MSEPITTKKELEQENEELKSRLKAMEDLIAKQKAAGQSVDPEPFVYYDPYDSDVNPLIIKENPEGKILSWKNPNVRNTRGWQGWTPVQYDDEIGRELDRYVNNPPPQMEGTATQDNYVRRGTDSILCWIDKRIWDTRKRKALDKANRRTQMASGAGNTTLMRGVSTFGEGVRTTASSRDGGKSAAVNQSNPSHQTRLLDEE